MMRRSSSHATLHHPSLKSPPHFVKRYRTTEQKRAAIVVHVEGDGAVAMDEVSTLRHLGSAALLAIGDAGEQVSVSDGAQGGEEEPLEAEGRWTAVIFVGGHGDLEPRGANEGSVIQQSQQIVGITAPETAALADGEQVDGIIWLEAGFQHLSCSIARLLHALLASVGVGLA